VDERDLLTGGGERPRERRVRVAIDEHGIGGDRVNE
jgi:hypothetical protein